MNKFIKEQLCKIKLANVPDYDDNTTELVFTRGQVKEVVDIELGKYYQIEVEDYILHPYEGFTLHDNWNRSIAPKDKYMNVEITDIMGKMVKVNGVGTDTTNMWDGWLPRKSFTVVKPL